MYAMRKLSNPSTFTFYKVLRADGTAPVSKMGWSLPVSYKSGMWHTVRGALRGCSNGLHLVKTPSQIADWLKRCGPKPRLFAVETRGEVYCHSRDKYVARTVRLNRELHPGTSEWKRALRGSIYEHQQPWTS